MPVTNQEHLLRDSKDRQDEGIDDAYGTQPPQSYSFLLFKHRQHIAGGVFKPRDRRAPASENPLFVLAAFKVDLQTHATRGQVIHGLLNVVYREIQDGKRCWSMIGFRINQDVPPASDMQL